MHCTRLATCIIIAESAPSWLAMIEVVCVCVITTHCVSFLQSQYQTIFETVLVFLESFDTYANFQNI